MRTGGRFLRPDGNLRAIGQRRRPAAVRASEPLAIDDIGRAGRAVATVATGFIKPVQFGPCGGHQFLGRMSNFVRIDRRAVVSRDKDRRRAAIQGDGRPAFQHCRQGRAARTAERVEHQFARPGKMADILTNGVVRFLPLVVGMHGIDGRVPGRTDRPRQCQRPDNPRPPGHRASPGLE